MSFTRYSNDPRIIKNKFAFTCRICKKHIPKGVDIIYFPATRSAKCMQCGDQDYRDFLASAVDEEIYNGRTF